MILLEEAISRYAVSAHDYGIRVRRHRRPHQAAGAVQDIEERLAPLRLPAELRSFWAEWSPRSFGSLFFDGLLPFEEAVAVYDRDVALGFPRVMMPLAYIENAGVWIELETPEHPGGRIYHTFYDDALLQLWCVDVSSLVHLVSEAVETGGVNDPDSMRPWLDVGVFDQVRLDRTEELLAMPDEWQVSIADREHWPAHWAAAEALPRVMIDLRGRTHTVTEFDQARASGRVSGTLVARVSGLISGAPMEGTLIDVTDGTGSIQLYVPVELEEAVRDIGLGGEVELDVIGEPSTDDRSIGGASMLRRGLDNFSMGHLRILGQMRRLDVSVAVTAIRSVG